MSGVTGESTSDGKSRSDGDRISAAAAAAALILR